MNRILFFIILFSVKLLFTQENSAFSRLKVYANELDIVRMSQLGIVVDHGTTRKGVFFISDFFNRERGVIDSLNLS